MSRHWLLLAAFVVCNLSVALAEDGLQTLLSNMNGTLEMGNYQGTFVFMRNGNIETMRITHAYSSDLGVKEKLTSLTGDAREVIRDQNILTCIWPKEKLVVIEPARARHGLPSSLPENVNELALHYKLTEVGQSRIAGFNCTMVRFEPLDEFRYGHELCVNAELGILLESKVFDASNKTIESMMFVSFRLLESVPSDLFEPGVHLNDYTWRVASVELDGQLQPDRAWKIQNLPPGFSLNNVTRRLMSASKKPVQHIVLTDGLASVSVFITKVDDPKHVYRGAHTKGIINAYARDLNQHQITIIGEVPESTVRMIGSSIFYSDP